MLRNVSASAAAFKVLGTGQTGAPIDVEDVAEDVVPAVAVKVEVGVLRQVDRGGLIGGGLDDQLQSVVIREAVGGRNIQIAGEALS